MELQLPYISATTKIFIFILVTILFLLSLIRHFINNNGSSAKNLPPGPWKLPIIGSLHHHLATGSLPQHTLSKLSKKYGPLMHLKLGEISAVVVSSPQMAKLFMKTHETSFGERPSTLATDIFSYNKSEIAFSPCNNHWKQMRKICVLELLSNKRVKSYSSIREDGVSNLVSFIGRSVGFPIDLSAQLYALTSSITCTSAFGEKFLNKSSLVSIVNDISMLMGGFNLCDLFPSLPFLALLSGMESKLQKIHKKMDVMLEDIIKKRREYNTVIRKNSEGGNQKEEDLLDVLLKIQQANDQEIPINDNNIKAIILEMFTGGTESSASIVDWAMAEMIKNPRVMDKAQYELRKSLYESNTKESHYLKLVVKETLRLHGPAPFLLPRECTETCEINGYTIPVKTKVIVNAWAIGRDPKVWGEDADRFIPERFEKNMFDFYGNNFEYIPFGAGRRICPGITFGLATVELVLAQLLYYFNWKLPNHIKPEELDMTDASGISGKRKNSLYLVADFIEATLVKS